MIISGALHEARSLFIIMIPTAIAALAWWQASRFLIGIRSLSRANRASKEAKRRAWVEAHGEEPFQPHGLVNLDEADIATLVGRLPSESRWLGSYSANDFTPEQLRIIAYRAVRKGEGQDMISMALLLVLGAAFSSQAPKVWHFLQAHPHPEFGDYLLHGLAPSVILAILFGLAWRFKINAARNLDDAKRFVAKAEQVIQERERAEREAAAAERERAALAAQGHAARRSWPRTLFQRLRTSTTT
ncbi:hypothetical protein Srot_0803 [Segniliparus rotundus DSM 44985]|uniref:Uncharacterized protein n=1 Tax=Segniliparus rotundus (strain ATCC BAA-972 / CDC 1076 / CIP 108378 / DSM 44985 / JCM 13578) TaxID=640132 RepID=D6ZE02_SEGRD|nr:hypothetical protein [Segniliparus rotundus]ADG97282.1 hypothetical protein Srot_0803 [Segniliparus rotundus DSM 44985]